MNRLHGGKRKSIVLAGAAFAALFVVLFAMPQPAQAVTARWINRFYINVDGQNYFDSNTYDGIFRYEQQTTNQCKSAVTFTINTGDGGSPGENLRFFFNDSTYNSTRWAKTFTLSTAAPTGAGATGCVNTPAAAVTVGDIGARKFNFYKTATGQIKNMASGVTFSKVTPTDNYKGSERFFRDDERTDPNNNCPDMILLYPADVMQDGDTIFGNGPVAGSATLFAVIKDANLGRVSETYATDSQLTNIDQNTCHVRGDAMDKARNGEYALYSSGNSEADRFVLSSGRDAASGAEPDDAFISFIGSTANLPVDPTTNAPIDAPTDPAAAGSVNGGQNTIDDQVCRGGGLGWIICPIASAIQSAADLLSSAMALFLAVNPLPIGSGPIYDSWNNVRNLSNIAFVLAFFAIIFSQATSIGISNYGIKRLLPRLILVAIATNVSYFVCSFMIDVFNILGVGITSLFAIVNGGSAGTVNISTGAGLVFGGSIAAFVTLAFTTGAIVQVIPFIVAAFIALVIVFIVLIARQALIILLVVLSPLAFVAALLPGTQQWFTRWMNLFVGMLVMYPLVMGMFAAGRMASAILSQVGGG